jgi:DNA-binding Lrp family transcriptional regulator
MLALLIRQPGQTVSSVARQMKLSLPAASQYLRALEARGLLTCQRVGLRVEYRPVAMTTEGGGGAIATALRMLVGRRRQQPPDVLFKLATAFTHPRRIEVYRAVKNGADSFVRVQAATHISRRALARHLAKLEARGFVKNEEDVYAVTNHAHPLGRVLALVLSYFAKFAQRKRGAHGGSASLSLICASCSGALPNCAGRGASAGRSGFYRRVLRRDNCRVALRSPPQSLGADAKSEGEETETRCKAFRVTRFFRSMEMDLDPAAGFVVHSGGAGGDGAICRSAADGGDVDRAGVVERGEGAVALPVDSAGADSGDVFEAPLDFGRSAVLSA